MAEPFNRSNTKCRLYILQSQAPSTHHIPAAPLPHHDVCLKDLHIAVHRLLQRHEGVFGGQL